MSIFVYKMIFWLYNKIEYKECQRFRPVDKNPGGFSFGIVRAVNFLVKKVFPNFKHIKFTKDRVFIKSLFLTSPLAHFLKIAQLI